MPNRIRFLLLMAIGMSAVIPSTASAAISEGFETATFPPAGGWQVINNSSPIGSNTTGWNRFTTNPWGPQTGVGHAGANFNATTGDNTISAWLITPSTSLSSNQTWSFWTRGSSTIPDRLQLLLSTNGSCSPGTGPTSVNDFTTVLLDINPTLASGVYPTTFTQFSGTLSGIPNGATGCFAFRYFVTNGGPTGPNSDIISIDTVEIGDVLAPPDGDGDGVPDASDSCPTEAASTPSGCPAVQAPPETPRDPDGDGDGTADSKDVCAALRGAAANGCPDVARTLTLKYSARKGTFKGNLGPAGGCAAGRPVFVYRRKKGPDPEIGIAVADAKGKYKVAKNAKPGKYYATGAAVTVASAGNCGAVQSTELVVPKP